MLDTINAAFHGSRVAADPARRSQRAGRGAHRRRRRSDPQAVGALLLRGRDGALVPLGKSPTSR